MLCEASARTASQALAMAWDALEQLTLDRDLVASAASAEAWQSAVDNLYLVLFNLSAARAALEEGIAVDAASLHREVLQHLGGEAATLHLSALTSGALRDIPPLGKLTLFAGLLREVTKMHLALPCHHPGTGQYLQRIDIRLRDLGSEVVAIAEPLIAGASQR